MGLVYLHPPKQTWNLKMDPWKRRFLLETIISRFHVEFQGCTYIYRKDQPNEGKYTVGPMDPMGIEKRSYLPNPPFWGSMLIFQDETLEKTIPEKISQVFRAKMRPTCRKYWIWRVECLASAKTWQCTFVSKSLGGGSFCGTLVHPPSPQVSSFQIGFLTHLLTIC